MAITALALAQLLQSCAPNIGPRTMTAIINVESGGNPLAVRDNTGDRSYYPKTTEEAVRLANYLLSRRHNLDLGISQVNSANFSGLGMSVREAFDPCVNIRNGASILAGDYRHAVSKFGPGQYALRRAIGAYNTGSLYAGDKYISMILSSAGIREDRADAVHVPNLASESQQGASTEASVPQAPVEAANAPIMPSTAVMRPENAPILVQLHSGLGRTSMAASAGQQGLTHIPVTGNAGLTHIPVNTVQMGHLPMAGSQDQLPGEAATSPDGAPMVVQPAQPGMQGGMMPTGQGGGMSPDGTVTPISGDPVVLQRTMRTNARRKH